MVDLALNTKVYLEGTWSLVIGANHRRSRYSQPCVEEVADEVRVWSLKIKRIAGDKLLPEGKNIRRRRSSCNLPAPRGLADSRTRFDESVGDTDLLRSSTDASQWRLVKGSRAETE